MYSKLAKALDDILALAGLVSVLSGVYLWFGLPPALILLGVVLIYIGARLPIRTTP
jgi:hypothetical protein